MSNSDYDEADETEDTGDEVEDDSEDGTELEAGAEAAEATPAESAAAAVQRNDIATAETLTVSSKEALRRQLEEEMERFLAKGGKIQAIDPDVSADPPQKPVSNYGSKPI